MADLRQFKFGIRQFNTIRSTKFISSKGGWVEGRNNPTPRFHGLSEQDWNPSNATVSPLAIIYL